eukprot:gb/GFBE01044638.1/.p1 GENE.gb/GFBE01044638.1/~~gb/GFBE01044638.1/.p1  ORF type:complete len:263 (+),score=66.95 gb/GFBE01044638.1/:1-789(+)
MSVSSSSGANACATVQRVLGLFDRFLSRNRIAAVVITAYLSLSVKIWNGASQAAPHPSTGPTSHIESLELEPLDRATVLARAKAVPLQGSEKGTKRVVLRRDASEDVAKKKCSAELIEEDPAVVLKKFLDSQAVQGSPSVPDEDLRLAWHALERLYSARGMHKQALEAQKFSMPSGGAELEDDAGDDLDMLATIAQEDCLDGSCDDPEGFLSLAQLGATYLVKEKGVQELAENEVRQWLSTFSLAGAGNLGCDADASPEHDI